MGVVGQTLVADSLAKVGLSGVERLYPSELSGGMKKRVALARAIIQDDSSADLEQVFPPPPPPLIHGPPAAA